MQLLGHLAASTLAAAGVARLGRRRARVETVLLPAALGGLTPDLLDKALLALEASRYGRTVGHSLVFLGGITLLWALVRALGSRRLSGPLGFLGLGVGTHLLLDLTDDALRGLIHGGQTFYAFFAWPFATPYAWVARNPTPLGGWPWAVTPLEVGVFAGALLALAWWGRGMWRAGAGADVSPETSGGGGRRPSEVP